MEIRYRLLRQESMCSEGQRRAVKSRKPPLRRAFWACNGTTAGSDRAAAQTDRVDGGGPRSGGRVLSRLACSDSDAACHRDRLKIVLRPCAVRHKFRDDAIIQGGSPASAVRFSSRPATSCGRDLTG